MFLHLVSPLKTSNGAVWKSWPCQIHPEEDGCGTIGSDAIHPLSFSLPPPVPGLPPPTPPSILLPPPLAFYLSLLLYFLASCFPHFSLSLFTSFQVPARDFLPYRFSERNWWPVPRIIFIKVCQQSIKVSAWVETAADGTCVCQWKWRNRGAVPPAPPRSRDSIDDRATRRLQSVTLFLTSISESRRCIYLFIRRAFRSFLFF